MTLLAGSVTVTGPTFPFVETKTGMAAALYDARKAAGPLLDRTTVPDGWEPDQTVADWEATADTTNLARLQAWAKEATAMAAGLVPYLTANAQVTVQVAAGGLQKSTNAGDPTDPPASPVNLTGTIT